METEKKESHDSRDLKRFNMSLEAMPNDEKKFAVFLTLQDGTKIQVSTPMGEQGAINQLFGLNLCFNIGHAYGIGSGVTRFHGITEGQKHIDNQLRFNVFQVMQMDFVEMVDTEFLKNAVTRLAQSFNKKDKKRTKKSEEH